MKKSMNHDTSRHMQRVEPDLCCTIELGFGPASSGEPWADPK